MNWRYPSPPCPRSCMSPNNWGKVMATANDNGNADTKIKTTTNLCWDLKTIYSSTATCPCVIVHMWINGVDVEYKKESLYYRLLRISLTNARYPTFDVNGNQGTRYILLAMNIFVEVECYEKFLHQETLIYLLSRWQIYLPLRHAGSQVPYLTLTLIPDNVLMSMG